MAQLLYSRIILQGTVNEPKGKPEPQFALPATVNWMRALSLAVDERPFTFAHLRSVEPYAPIRDRDLSDHQVNSIYEQLFLALNQLSALGQLRTCDTPADVGRTAIITWYYAIYNAASAMICARQGSVQEDHMSTAKQWVEQISRNGLALYPFDALQITLRKTVNKRYSDTYKAGSQGTLKSQPENTVEARGALGEYVSGCLNWYRWRTEEHIRNSREFKDLGVEDFRTKAARMLRDERFDKQRFGFLHQAFRYRGKANYREALFLAYGPSANSIMSRFVVDLENSAAAFLSMASAYCSRVCGTDPWNAFVADVEQYKAFTKSGNEVWAAV